MVDAWPWCKMETMCVKERSGEQKQRKLPLRLAFCLKGKEQIAGRKGCAMFPELLSV